MRSVSHLPAKVKAFQPASVQYLTFEEILKCLGKHDDHFYIIDSAEIKICTALFRPFQTNDLSILYVEQGNMTVRYDNIIYTLSPGMLLLKLPNAILQVLEISRDCQFRLAGFMQQCMSNPGMPVKQMEALMLLAGREPVLTLEPDNRAAFDMLLALLQLKERSAEKGQLHLDSVKHAFSMLVLEVASLFKRNTLNRLKHISRKEQLTLRFLQLLREHVKDQRSVQFYADLLFVTPKYLSKCVKEVTGKTCGEIIDDMVVAQAKTLLENHTLTIGQVADELHFSDQFFFSKFFKKHTGTSPLHYRTAV